ncbi:MAG: CRISPR-associated helicase Cas3', partial [Planctomycetes bacterium]|nr:CRISPR-associated helicase Cas3' [Planctomycetota bacterium]
MDAPSLLWAKKTQAEPCRYHPLVCHLIDVAAAADALWDHTLGRHCRSALAASLACDTDQAQKWISFWAGLHDIGKASPDFQGKDAAAKIRLQQGGYPFPAAQRYYHGTMTAATLEAILAADQPEFAPMPATLARRVATILGGHHGVFPRSIEVNNIPPSILHSGPWQEARKTLAASLAGVLRVNELPPLAATARPDHAFAMTLAGLVSIADWIGSAEEFFPYATEETDLEQYAAKARTRAQEALAQIGWSQWSAPTSAVSFIHMFPKIATPRPLQQQVVQLALGLESPTLVLIEAPTGEGKTEAAMYLADHWAATLKQRGCYFALPTQATSNQMFSRVLRFLGDRYTPEHTEKVNLLLTHGHAALSAEFRVLRHNAGALISPEGIDDNAKTHDGAPPNIVAAEWFTHRKRGLLAPFGVGTIDQALLAVLQTKHVFVRLFGLAHKTVIIDEVHAYDVYMSTLLERLLEWLAALGSSVVLLSATLPQAKRKALLTAYARGTGRTKLSFQAAPYPRISWVCGDSAKAQSFPAAEVSTKTINIDWTGNNPANIGRLIKQALAQGGCAAVICNTVRRAQETYLALKELFANARAKGQD